MPSTIITPGSLLPVGIFKDANKNDLLLKTPMEIIMKHIESKLSHFHTMDDRILVLKAPTGAGKSSVMAEAYYQFYTKMNKRNIYGTQPKVTNAINIVEELPNIQRYKSSLIKFQSIGYITGPFKMPVRGLNLITAGTLSMMLRLQKDEEILDKISFIMIDEAHDRSIDTDQLFYYIKQLLKRNINNPKTPYIIIMSATFDEKYIANYFNSTSYAELIGSQFPIENNWTQAPVVDYVESSVNRVISIINSISDFNDMNDIIIFAPGNKEIKKICEMLNFTKDINIPIATTEFTGTIAKEKGEAFTSAIERPASQIHSTNTDSKSSKIKIIVTTSAIETGVTIGSLKYCIDYGRNRTNGFMPRYNAEIMYDAPASQDIIMQRRGRIGRKQPGFWYPQYTEKDYALLNVQLHPDILSKDVSTALLSLLINSAGMVGYTINVDTLDEIYKFHHDFKHLDILSPLLPELIQHYMNKFRHLGLITKNTFTPLGVLISKFAKTSIERAKVILSAYVFEIDPIILIEMMAIAELYDNTILSLFTFESSKDKEKLALNTNILFLKGIPQHFLDDPAEYLKDPNKIVNKYRIMFSDEMIEHYFIFSKIKEMHKSFMPNFTKFEKWMNKYGLNLDTYYMFLDIRDQIILEVDKVGFNPFKKFPEYTLNEWVKKIKLCLFEGFKYNLLKYKDGAYVNNMGDNVEIFAKVFNKYDDYRPRGVIAQKITFNPIGKSSIYKLNGFMISVLDGFIYFM